MRGLVQIAMIAALIVWAVVAAPRTPTQAMPNFAQAYGVDCNTCHTQVPMLNAYGRYIQRTGYATLDPAAMKRAVPIWIGEQTAYDTQDPAFPHQVKFGNLALHGAGDVGPSNNFTFHAHQWLWEGEQGGGVDTLWVTYNNLLHRNGHLFVGKIEAPGPSAFSQWTDISGFATPSLTVGEHAWQNDANRWGAKFGYVHGPTNLEIGYLGADTDLNGATDWIPVNGHQLQYRVAYAEPTKPLELGVYGSTGSVPLAEGGIDRFGSIAGYVQRDPTHGIPGLLAIYQRGVDGNPGNGAIGPAPSAAYTVEVYQPVFRDRVLVAFRREMTNDGMGTTSQFGNIDLTVRINKFLRLYSEAGLNQNGTPAWRWFVWWTTPVFKEH